MRAVGGRERARGKMARAGERRSGGIVRPGAVPPTGRGRLCLPARTAPRPPSPGCRRGVLLVCGTACPRAVRARGALTEGRGGSEKQCGQRGEGECEEGRGLSVFCEVNQHFKRLSSINWVRRIRVK